MRVHRAKLAELACAIALLLLAALTWTACGGSGSSGFDGAVASEAAAIQRAIEQGSCVTFQGTSYCGSGAAAEVDGSIATVAFEQSGEPLTCTQVAESALCTTSLRFAPTGFPDATEYLAAWGESAEGPWVLAATTPPTQAPNDGGESRDVEVALPEPSAGLPPSPVIIAVLVYLPFSSGIPADLPAVGGQLRDFGAEIVYLSPELEVQIEP